MDVKIYTIIGGVNGVGKSSILGVLKQFVSDLGEVIDIDRYSKSNSLSSIEASRDAIKRINFLLENGITFTQETTISGRKTIAHVLQAKGLGYRIRLYYVGLNSAEESIKRIKNRVENGGHYIDDEDVLRRFRARFENLARLLPLCDEAYFFDNSNGFEAVGEYKGGELISACEELPTWLDELRRLLEEEKRKNK